MPVSALSCTHNWRCRTEKLTRRLRAWLRPGTYFMELTLHRVTEPVGTLDRILCPFEVIPPGKPNMNGSFVEASITDRPVAPVITEHDGMPPLELCMLGDTIVFDGMKSFLVDYSKALQGMGAVRATYLDLTGSFPALDTGFYGPAAAPDGVRALFTEPAGPTAVTSMMLDAGIRIVRGSLSCPRELCVDDDALERLTSRDGPLYAAKSWAALPPLVQDTFIPVALHLAQCDIMLSGYDGGGSVQSDFSSMYIQQLALLANPSIVRLLDLGEDHTRLLTRAATACDSRS